MVCYGLRKNMNEKRRKDRREGNSQVKLNNDATLSGMAQVAADADMGFN